MIKDYKDLKVWNKGIEISDNIYLLTKQFPKDEIYGLSSQMRRASVSIPSNIAEGFMRNYKKEYIQFIYVALGSCAELETQLIIAERQKYVPSNKTQTLLKLLNEEMRMLSVLIRNLK